jgi:DNA-directed RNA polymerase subunit RPC12/RpoP
MLMHVADAGQVDAGAADDLGKPLCSMRCARCGDESEWLVFDTVTEAKRGIPCQRCNAPEAGLLAGG